MQPSMHLRAWGGFSASCDRTVRSLILDGETASRRSDMNAMDISCICMYSEIESQGHIPPEAARACAWLEARVLQLLGRLRMLAARWACPGSPLTQGDSLAHPTEIANMLSDLLRDLPRDITSRLRAEVRPRACKPAEPQPWCAASVAAGSKVMQTSENETYIECTGRVPGRSKTYGATYVFLGNSSPKV